MIQTDKGQTTKYMQRMRGKRISFFILIGALVLTGGYFYYKKNK